MAYHKKLGVFDHLDWDDLTEKEKEIAAKFSCPTAKYKKDTVFHIGRYSQPGLARTLICAICGHDKFYVGSDSWWTGVKCVNCESEYCVHEG